MRRTGARQAKRFILELFRFGTERLLCSKFPSWVEILRPPTAGSE